MRKSLGLVTMDSPRGTRRTQSIVPSEMWEGYSEKVKQLIAQLKCPYTNACRLGDKLEEFGIMVQLENYDLDAIMET